MNDKKTVTLFVVLFLVISLFTVGSLAPAAESQEKNNQTYRLNRRFDFSEPRVLRNDESYEVKMDGAESMVKDGAPPLPVSSSRILVPYGKEVTNVEAEFKDKELLDREIELEKTQVKVLGKEVEDSTDDTFAKSMYPETKLDYDVMKIRGYRVLTLRLKPVEYYPKKGEVWSYDSADVQIELQEGKRVNELYRGLEKDRKMINDMIDETDHLYTYPDPGSKDTMAEVEYLMVTTSSLESSFQTLIDQKEDRGISTAVELVSDIESSYTGDDTQEKIRNCIEDYYNNNGTVYVALAGDTTDESGNDILPHRGLYADCSAAGGCADEVPSDYYYAGLDGTWDDNGNGVYGEWDDNPDWGMEVWVGRIPAQDTTEADTMINKILSWENGNRTEQHYSICQDDTGNIGDMKRNKIDNTQYSDAVHDLLPSEWSINTDFESNTGGNTVQMYHDGISGSSSGGTPPMFVNHGGHGSPTLYNIGGTYYTRDHVSSLSNDWYPIHASIACTAGTFDGRDNDGGSYTSDRDCLAEEFLKYQNGGYVATFMNTRYGLGTTDGGTGLSGAIDTRLYKGVFSNEYNNLGHAAQWARMSYMQSQGEDEFARWSTQAMNLLGDPEMPVLEEELSVTIDSPAENDIVRESNVTVEWTSKNFVSNEIRIDQEPWVDVGTSTAYTFVDVKDGDHTVQVNTMGAQGGTVTDIVNFTVQTVGVEITSPINGEEFSEPDVTVEWTSEYADYHEIRLDHGVWENVGDSVSHPYTGLEEGEHTVEVRATDVAGYETVDSISFFIDHIPPEIEIHSPSEGQIIENSSVNVEWTGHDETSGIDYYEVRLKGGNWEGVGENTSYTFDLEDGEHTVEVGVYDNLGNSETTNVSFVVDTTSPDLQILSPEDGDTFDKEQVTVEWSGDDETSGIDYYEVRLEGSNWQEVGDNTSSTFNLEEGEYTVDVRAIDNASNSETTTVSFMVDTTSPDLQILSPEDGATVDEEQVTVEWSGNDEISGIYYYEIRLEDGEWEEVGDSTTYTFNLEDGSYTLEMRATDNAGNSEIASVSFTVDATLPELKVISPDEGSILNESEVKVEWRGEDDYSGLDFYEIRFEDEVWEGVGESTTYTFNLEDGSYTVEVRATDNAGNNDTTKVSFTVDTTSPDLEITHPSKKSILNESEVEIEWLGQDEISGVNHSEVRLEGGSWEGVGESTSYTFDLEDGEHTLEVKATDNAGNTETTSVSLTIDTVPPTLEIESPEAGVEFEEDSVSVGWSGEPRGTEIVAYEVRIDDKEWIELNESTQHVFEGLENGEHTVEIRAKDQAGNTAVESVDFTVETGQLGIGGTSGGMWYLLPLILIIVIVLVLVVLIVSRRKKEEPDPPAPGAGRRPGGPYPPPSQQDMRQGETEDGGWKEAPGEAPEPSGEPQQRPPRGSAPLEPSTSTEPVPPEPEETPRPETSPTPPPPPAQQSTMQDRICPTCGSQLKWIEENESWYCDNCQEYK
ncbi:MAG: C25 family cysteine peptidase [Candidatus Thermoplasmatota archaeon]